MKYFVMAMLFSTSLYLGAMEEEQEKHSQELESSVKNRPIHIDLKSHQIEIISLNHAIGSMGFKEHEKADHVAFPDYRYPAITYYAPITDIDSHIKYLLSKAAAPTKSGTAFLYDVLQSKDEQSCNEYFDELTNDSARKKRMVDMYILNLLQGYIIEKKGAPLSGDIFYPNLVGKDGEDRYKLKQKLTRIYKNSLKKLIAAFKEKDRNTIVALCKDHQKASKKLQLPSVPELIEHTRQNTLKKIQDRDEAISQNNPGGVMVIRRAMRAGNTANRHTESIINIGELSMLAELCESGEGGPKCIQS